MNSLRFLLVHRNPGQSVEIADRLAHANHTVFPTTDLAEAADALTMERFDAILMEPAFQPNAVDAFAGQLRQLERSQKSASRVPVIALSNDHGTMPAALSGFDAVMPEQMDPEALTNAVSQLARVLSRTSQPADSAGDTSSEGSGLVILDPEKFREQVGDDNDLMMEIIDLFLDERQRQEPEMRTALESGKFDELSRLAHTIKGSLGSLAAMRAKAHAQDLETAAKHSEEDVCWQSLAALESDLAELEPELIALRQM